MTQVTAIAAGRYNTYALRLDETVWATGSNAIFIEGGYYIGHTIVPDGSVYLFDTSVGSYSIPFHMPSGDMTRESYPPATLIAGFTVDVTSGITPLTVHFTDQSLYAPDAWSWDFNNDGTPDSTLQNPSYTFTTNVGNKVNSSGTFIVSVTAASADSKASLFINSCIIIPAANNGSL